MLDPLPVSLPLRLSGAGARRSTRFALAPDDTQRDALAQVLGISAVRDLRFDGEVRPVGRTDFELEARLQATVVQPCVVSLVPVFTEIDQSVRRHYIADYAPVTAEEAEVPEDDTQEPLPAVLDAGAVMTEALALALPDYPRAAGAELANGEFGPPGVKPVTDADLRPFAGLAGLAKRLSDDEHD